MSDFFLRSPHLKKRKKIRSEEEDDNDEFIFGNHLQGDDDDVENDISQIEVEEDFESNNQEQIEALYCIVFCIYSKDNFITNSVLIKLREWCRVVVDGVISIGSKVKLKTHTLRHIVFSIKNIGSLANSDTF